MMKKICEFLTYYAMLFSVERAKERGSFPLFEKSDYRNGLLPVEGFYHKELWSLNWDYLVEQILKYGIRNFEVTTIAPTGSIAMLADTSFSIEPEFALVYEKRVSVGSYFYIEEELEKELKRIRLWNEELIKKIHENGGSVQGIEEIPEEIKKVFITALDIPWWDHIRMQAIAQMWITTSISKTINMPFWSSIEDVEKAFLFAYRSGCKGITIYREASREKQVFYTGGFSSKDRILENIRLVRNRTLEILKKFGIDFSVWKKEEKEKKRYWISF